MYVSTRTAVALLTASALAGSATTAVSALGHQSGQGTPDREGGSRMVLSTSLVPSVPTDPGLLDTAAGGVPWVLGSGEAKLRSDGRLTVHVRGLLIPTGQFAGSPGPVKTITASVYCAANSTPVGTSGSVPLSSAGDARITTTITLRTKCQIPALLIHPNGTLGAYIATSGIGG